MTNEDLRLRDRALAAVSEGVLITDATGPHNLIVYANESFERLTGYAVAEILGRNCRFLQGEGSDPAAVARMREAVRLGQSCTAELLNYRKDGTPFWNSVSLSPVRDEAGNLTHFVGVQADVSERRRMQEQYLQAQKLEAVALLAEGVAHDFNNLLTIINGYTDLLLQGLAPDDPKGERLTQIRSAGERSAVLARQLLTFSRKGPSVHGPLDVNAVITEVHKLLARIIGEDVVLELALEPALGSVKADQGQLEQVLMNLAVNARDAMPRGGRLTLETANLEPRPGSPWLHADVPPGAYVVLTVRDTGSGMTREVMKRIFEPFFTTKGPTRGTGLGLAVVHGIVKGSGGHLKVTSEVGAGTAFRVYLPRVDLPAGSKPATPSLKTFPKGDETLLLVEDEVLVRTLALHVFKLCGYRVLEAAGGAEALRLAAGHDGPLDLLVTDVVMPGMSGPELAERLQKTRPGLRVLFLSGYPHDAVSRHDLLPEAVDHLQKPFAPSQLAHAARAALDGGLSETGEAPVRGD